MKVRSRKLCALLLCAVFSVSQTAVAGAAEIPAEISADAQDTQENDAAAEDDTAASAGDETTVTIYSTNDIHGNVAESDGHIGLAQVAGIAESTENSLLIDAGDATQGDSFASVDAGQSVIQVMNSAGYGAMALGNHEFDYGPDELAANVAAASFPILSANVEGLDGVDYHEIITVADKKIAVVGLTTTATKPSKFKGLVVGDETEAAKREIAEVKDEADAIILVTHMGDNEAAVKCTSKKLLDSLTPEELAEVTAVVDGHSHTLETEPYRDIPIVQTGTQLANLGQITLHFTGEDVTAEGSVLNYEQAMSYPVTGAGEEAKARVSSFIADMQEQQKPILEETVGYNENVPLWGGYIYYDYAEPRIVETNFGDFICDAFYDAAGGWLKSQGKKTKKLIALENGGGVDGTLPFWKVTKGDILNTFSHGNMVEILRITPAELYKALEAGVEPIVGQDDETGVLLRENVSGKFMQVGGFAYSYKPDAPAGEKVQNVVSKSLGRLKRTDDKTKLYLATTNYVADSFFQDAKVVTELGGEDMVVEDAFRKADEGAYLSMYVTPGERINIVDDKSPATYDVDIPALLSDTKENVPAGSLIAVQIDNGDIRRIPVEEDGVVHLTLEKGAHTIYAFGDKVENEDGTINMVYVNNYSGSGTVTTKDGYYAGRFELDREDVSSYASKEEYAKNQILEAYRLKWKDSKLMISWGAVDDADGYDIFVDNCSKKLNDKDLVKTVKKAGKISVKLSKVGKKAISAKKNYQCRVRAYQLSDDGSKEYIAETFVGHIASKKSKNKTNPKSIEILNKQGEAVYMLTLAAPDENGEGGGSEKLEVKFEKQDSKKTLLHGQQKYFISSNSGIASVDESGTVTAKGKGSCLILVYGANGVMDLVFVSVE